MIIYVYKQNINKNWKYKNVTIVQNAEVYKTFNKKNYVEVNYKNTKTNNLIAFIEFIFNMKRIKNYSFLSIDFVKADEIIPVGIATIPKPIIKMKNVNIFPPTVIG